MKRKPKKILDPAKLAAMRERMARARAAKLEKRPIVADIHSEPTSTDVNFSDYQISEQDTPRESGEPPEAAAGENDGLPSSPVVDSAPSPAAPSGGITEGEPIESIRVGLANIMPEVSFAGRYVVTPSRASKCEPPSAPEAPPEPPKTEWPSYMPVAMGEPQEMTVQSLPQNPGLVLCSYSGRDGIQHVHVGVHDNFVKGMKLKAIIHPTKPAMWMLHGALPKYRGRW